MRCADCVPFSLAFEALNPIRIHISKQCQWITNAKLLPAQVFSLAVLAMSVVTSLSKLTEGLPNT